MLEVLIPILFNKIALCLSIHFVLESDKRAILEEESDNFKNKSFPNLLVMSRVYDPNSMAFFSKGSRKSYITLQQVVITR